MTRRIIVLGLDGATWRLLDPFMDDGTMPRLAEACRYGVRASWQSTIPPFSAQAWVSLMTGRNPAKHGVTDFWELGDDRGTSNFVNSTRIHGEAIWNILARNGERIGIVNVPVTYPPPAVSGYAVSGLLTPPAATDYTYPEDLRNEILDIVPDYQPDPYDPLRPGLSLVKEFQCWMDNHERVAQYLLERHPVALFISVAQALDQLQHLFWDDLAAIAEGDASTVLREELRRCFRLADEAVGHRLDMLDESTTLFIISDHGFGPARRFFHVNRFLADHGLLAFAEGEASPSQRLMKRLGIDQQSLKDLVRRADFLGLRRRIGRMTRMGLARRLETMVAVPLDWQQTRAFAGSPASEGIFVNVRGLQPHGCVSPGAEYEAVRDEILAAVRDLRDPETGQPVVAQVWRREEVYDGPALSRMPDVVFSFGQNPYLASDSLSAPTAIGPIPADYLQGRHCPDGILVAVGADIAAGATMTGASVLDLVPTLLYALGLPIPDDVDGRALSELFTPAFQRSRAVRLEPAHQTVGSAESDKQLYSEEESAAMERRLRGLGYLG
jgi:predicted AlkP superfamily phosphohydrolase/phosphomutase